MADGRKPRIGPVMCAAWAYVRANPGCSKYEVSRAVGPHGSNNYGNRAVWRAIAAGLIRYEFRGGRYHLYAVTGDER